MYVPVRQSQVSKEEQEDPRCTLKIFLTLLKPLLLLAVAESTFGIERRAKSYCSYVNSSLNSKISSEGLFYCNKYNGSVMPNRHLLQSSQRKRGRVDHWVQNAISAALAERSAERWSSLTPSCSAFGLQKYKGLTQRKIYYAIIINDEIEMLAFVLNEIYPAVDVIIIGEDVHTFKGDPKPLHYYDNRNHPSLIEFKSKIRHLPFSSCLECRKRADTRVPYRSPRQAWLREHALRSSLVEGALDANPDDIFIVADTDELVSRNFLSALKRCYLFESVIVKRKPKLEKCSHATLKLLAFEHYFDCWRPGRPQYHPDIAPAFCAQAWGGERLRMWQQQCKKCNLTMWNGRWKYFTSYHSGWHLRSFLPARKVRNKFKSFSEHFGEKQEEMEDLENIKSSRKSCISAIKNSKGDKRFLLLDSEKFLPLPYAIKEHAEKWIHFLQDSEQS